MKNILSIIATMSIIFSAQAQDKQINKAVEGNNAFCFDLMEAGYEPSENMVFSPFSISTALAMTYDGTAWRTKWDMAKTMHFPFSRQKNHESWTQILDYFKQLKTPVFQLANAVWAQENYYFTEEFMEGLKDFDARVEYVDFRNTVKREEARRRINQWVEAKTERKIRQLIRKRNVNDLTRMILVNAIYFNADWQTQFDPEKTRKNDFHTPDGEIETDFMTMKSDILHAEKENFRAIQLPYRDELASMYILLPAKDKKPADIVTWLNNDQFNSLCDDFKETKIMLALPRFKVEERYEMKKTLKKMGMVAPFSNYANFSNMNGEKNLVIDDVIHQAVVEVDEEGTEAAAATAVVIREKTAKRPLEFIVDKPFIFIIKEHKQGNILFAGIVNNPEKTK
ncbi:MAG: serpin family protein [Bacteroidota bacterium]|nr:serpin family protein [Bacteroidota bacterium]